MRGSTVGSGADWGRSGGFRRPLKAYTASACAAEIFLLKAVPGNTGAPAPRNSLVAAGNLNVKLEGPVVRASRRFAEVRWGWSAWPVLLLCRPLIPGAAADIAAGDSAAVTPPPPPSVRVPPASGLASTGRLPRHILGRHPTARIDRVDPTLVGGG